MNTAAVRQIVLGQPNPLPECKSLSRFADTVRDTQSSRFSVLTRGAFIVERAGQAQAADVGSTTDASPTSAAKNAAVARSEEHTSELQSLMRISYAVFCLK